MLATIGEKQSNWMSIRYNRLLLFPNPTEVFGLLLSILGEPEENFLYVSPKTPKQMSNMF